MELKYNTVVINLASRTDRLDFVKSEIKRFGITDYKVFEAYEGRFMGFNKSMFDVLDEKNFQLILEDDCKFLGTKSDLDFCIKQLPDDFDMLYLGANVKSEQKRFSDKLWHLNDAWTTHAVLYSPKGARWCKRNYDFTTIYDNWLRNVAQKQLKCFIVKPFLAVQKDDFSDLQNKDVIYNLRDTERFLKP